MILRSPRLSLPHSICFLNREMGMMDLRQKGLLLADTKCCVDCKTTKTPLWRGGPTGPKSLCNACGIRFRKRRISTIGTNRGYDRKRERVHNNGSTITTTVSATTSSTGTTTTTTSGSGDGDGDENLGECGSLGMRLMMALEEEVMVVQNLPSSVKKQRFQRERKLGEEEKQAAVSLMALSCGSVLS
ncbi:GATA transcription factor 17-like [Benincasa hispida]|uniref:GATA transcription factor 17-like n=1 Tax=Benincasa hispida TaxID=102211 RepID=UPI001901837A|nr:GATA transcription factor 17-like [Benincasa hispida]